jgi:hypothetical protein
VRRQRDHAPTDPTAPTSDQRQSRTLRERPFWPLIVRVPTVMSTASRH